MFAADQWHFGTFRLDPAHACLWRGEDALVLPPKPFAVLQYLVTHPNRLVTKAELLDAVWPETAVTDAVLRVAIGTVRKLLGDPAPTPRYIATVPRRGYRFLAPVTVAHVSGPWVPSPLLIERDAVLQQLQRSLAHVQQWTRQVVLVTGEPGIGKTAVVETLESIWRRRMARRRGRPPPNWRSTSPGAMTPAGRCTTYTGPQRKRPNAMHRGRWLRS